MTTIHQEDLIASVADALQYISYYHPLDYIQALGKAYEREQSPAARDAIAQILTNSRMSAQGHRPICQDTGIVAAFVKVGMEVRWDDATMGVGDMVNEGVRRAYLNPDNVLRASVVSDPAGDILHTKSGALRISPDHRTVAWLTKGKRAAAQPLVAIDLGSSAGTMFVYNDLGVYLAQPLGTPCDDL